LNPATLCLPAAGLAGLACAWLGLTWLRLLEVALPTARPAAAWAVPCVLGGAAVAALYASRLVRSPLAAARRALALAAAAVLWAGAPAALEPPGLRSAAITVLPAVLAAGCLLAGVAWLAVVRGRWMPPTPALGRVLAATAGGAALGAASYAGLLTSDLLPTTAASLALLSAALLCSPLWSCASSVAEYEARALELPAQPTARERGRRVADISPWIGGFALASAPPALVTLLDQLHGAALLTRIDLAIGLACGGVLAGSMLRFDARRAADVRGLGMIGLALALMLSHWLPGVRLGALSGRVAGLIVGLPVGLCATGLMLAGAGAASGSRAAPLAWAAFGATVGALCQVSWEALGVGTTLRAAALMCAALSIPAGLAVRAPAASVLASARRWMVPSLGAATVWVLGAGGTAAPEWRSVAQDRQLLAIAEGPRGVVTLVQTADGGVRIGIDNRTLLPGRAGALLEQRMARLCAGLAPTARDALVLGLGDGQLPVELATLLPGTVTCVERVGALVELAEELPWASARLAARPVLQHGEPLAALQSRRGRCALVVVAPEEPGRPGAGARMSREHYRVLREALAPGGVAVQWLPLHCMPWPAFASATQAFLEAFPDTRLFVASLLADVPLVALVGGLGSGLPGSAAMDAVLGRQPSAAGLSGAADVHDLHVADGWTLLSRLRDAPASSVAQPWVELLSMRRASDAPALSRINLRLLADIAVPLDTASMQVRPAQEQDDRRLGMELVARSEAAVALLAARAIGLELSAAAPGSLSSDERGVLEQAWYGLLLRAWSSAPGHLDVREALLEHALGLTRDGRWALAATLLDNATAILADGTLLGLQCGILLKLDQPDEAVRLGREAVALVPGDRTALLNYGSALLFARRDDEARTILVRARDVFRPQPLPPLQTAALDLLEDDPASTIRAAALVDRLPATEPWVSVLRRLLERARTDGG
jgi:spermidine synthase/Flp pilus assembly protein TadD